MPDVPQRRVTDHPLMADPSKLTIEMLLRENKSLRELLEARMAGVDNVLREKFITVDQQFALVEKQRVEQKKDTKDAVDAALTAQKEAVKEQTNASERAISKSEAATSKQIENLSTTFQTEVTNLHRELADEKELRSALSLRIAAQEQQKVGRGEAISNGQALIGLIVFLLLVANFLISILK